MRQTPMRAFASLAAGSLFIVPVVTGQETPSAPTAESHPPAADDELRLSLTETVPRCEIAPGPYPAFGVAGSEWLNAGVGYASDLEDDNDFNLYAGYSNFIADELEFAVQGELWYFDQLGDDAFGLNGNMYLRWHFWHTEDWRWSVYGETGVGLLISSDVVPDTGTGINFTPRVGMGLTHALRSDLRLQAGFRWHHISNGRISGNLRNPSRDSLMVYAGVMIPF